MTRIQLLKHQFVLVFHHTPIFSKYALSSKHIMPSFLLIKIWQSPHITKQDRLNVSFLYVDTLRYGKNYLTNIRSECYSLILGTVFWVCCWQEIEYQKGNIEIYGHVIDSRSLMTVGDTRFYISVVCKFIGRSDQCWSAVEAKLCYYRQIPLSLTRNIV